MLDISTNIGSFELATDQKIKIEYKSPLFNEIGTRSMPFEFPNSNINNELLSHPENRHPASKETSEIDVRIAFQINELLRGTIKKIESSLQSHQVYFRAGNGEFNSISKTLYLNELDYNEQISTSAIDVPTFGAAMDASVYNYNQNSHYIFAPVYMPNIEGDPDLTGREGAQLLNYWNIADQKFSFAMLPLEIVAQSFIHTAPQPFLWFVAQKIFELIGYNVIYNDLYEDEFLRKQVLFNSNTTHVLFDKDGNFLNFGYYLNFFFDLPHVLISDFITAIETRFFIKVIVNETNKSIEIKLWNNIIDDIQYEVYEHGYEYLKSINDITGIDYSVEMPDDDYTQQNIADDIDIYDSVQSISDLPIPNNYKTRYYYIINQNLFVRYEENTYLPLGYNFNKYNYLTPSESIESASGSLLMYNLIDYPYDYRLIARTDRIRPSEAYPTVITQNEYKDLIFMSYEGLIDMGAGIIYPVLTSHNYYMNNAYNYVQIPNTNTLSAETEYGIIAKYGLKYLYWYVNLRFQEIRKIHFSIADLIGLNFSRKIRIDENNYLIDSFDVEFSNENFIVSDVKLQKI